MNVPTAKSKIHKLENSSLKVIEVSKL